MSNFSPEARQLTIAIDWDEVVEEYLDSLNQFMNEALDMPFNVADFVRYTLNVVFPDLTQDQTRKILDEFHDSEYFDLMQTVIGAKEAIFMLRSIAEIYVVTARQYIAAFKTIAAAQKNFPEGTFAGFCFTNAMALSGDERKKSEVIQSLGKVDLIIEDSFSNILDCLPYIETDSPVKAILLTRRWNQDIPDEDLPEGVVRAQDWPDILKIVGLMYLDKEIKKNGGNSSSSGDIASAMLAKFLNVPA